MNAKIFIDIANAKEINLETVDTPYSTAVYEEVAVKLTGKSDKTGALGFFIVATEQGFDRALPDKTANGIKIQREYLDNNSKVKGTFIQGEDITVRIRVRANGNIGYFENAAIIDLLLGAFEVKSESVSALRQQAYGGDFSDRLFDYVDVREDRLVFYMPITNHIYV